MSGEFSNAEQRELHTVCTPAEREELLSELGREVADEVEDEVDEPVTVGKEVIVVRKVVEGEITVEVSTEAEVCSISEVESGDELGS